VKRIVTVGSKNERREAVFADRYPQLLVQFADQTGLGRLAGLQLAAGKFPKASQRLALRALAQKHPAIAVDQGRRGDQKQGLAQLR
jgi:hypothetical protein